MQNRHKKCRISRKALSEQNWNVNMMEQIRHLERKMRGKTKLTVFILRALFIVLCIPLLLSIFSETDPVNHIVNFALFGIAAMTIFTAIVFLSGYADPGSFCWKIDRRRQKRARHDKRFTIKRIVLYELWIVYAVLLCVMLQDFIFSAPDLPDKKGFSIALFAILTILIFVAAMLLSGPRSFWGRMRRFIEGKMP
jgi:predicted membrane channel-forming protein YqfA (hemolysin III family)